MFKRLFKWLTEPMHEVHYLWLNKRSHIFGGQLVYAVLVLLQPVIMIGTVQTAISRFDDMYGGWTQVLGAVTFVSLLLLIADGWLSYSDWSKHNGLSALRISVWLARLRHWLYGVCALWSIGLMSTAQAESGLVSMLLYMFYFGAHAGVPIVLFILDSCQINQRQKAEWQRTRRNEVCDATV